MPGPSQPWDQSGDPRENTVDLPRIDLAAGFSEYLRGPGSAAGTQNGAPGSHNGPAGSHNGPAGTSRNGANGSLSHPAGPGLTPLPEPPSHPAPYSGPRPDYAEQARPPDPLPPVWQPPAPRLPAPQLSAPQPPATRPPTSQLSAPQPPAPQPAVPPPPVPSAAPRPIAPLSAEPDPVAPRSAAAHPAVTEQPQELARPYQATRWLDPAVEPALGPAVEPTAVLPPGTRSGAASGYDRHADTAVAAAPEPPPAAYRPARPSAGSRADLRSRLSKLPDGHPSAFFDDGGIARPLPTRLKQLELGLPAPGREPVDGVGRRLDYPAASPAIAAPISAPAAVPAVEPSQAAEPERAGHPDTGDGRVPADTTPDPGPAPDPYEQARAILAELQSISAQAAQAQPATDSGPAERSEPASAISGAEGFVSPVRREEPPLSPAQTRPPGQPSWPARDTGSLPAHRDADERDERGVSRPPLPRRVSRSPGPGAYPDRNGDPIADAQPDWRDPFAAAAGDGQARRGRSGASPDDRGLAPWPAERRSTGQYDGRPGPDGAPRPDAGAGPDGGPGHSDVFRTHGDSELTRPARSAGNYPDARRPGPRFEAKPAADPGERGRAMHGPDLPGPGSGPRLPDLRQIVGQAMTASRVAEGQTVFGGYGSSGLTPAIQRIAAQLPYGGLAPGSEANTLKPADRFAAKLARLAARNPGQSPEELARSIGDVVRYAFTFEPADYTEGTWLVHRKLKAHGFELEARRNRWESPEYKGIFTRWRDPAHDQAFEVQFHTMASWAVTQRTHGSYVQITDPATSPAERARLRSRQVAAAAEAKAPPGCMEIADFRPEQR